MIQIKKVSKNIWDEFVYGGHFLALGDVIAMYVIAIILKINISWDFLVVVYLCVFASNLLNRTDESEEDAITNPVRVKIMKKYSDYFHLIVSMCLAASAILIFSFGNVQALLFAIFIIAIAALYTTSLKNLTRYVIGFKNLTAALFYALMVFFLAIYHHHSIDFAVLLMFVFYYLRIFISSAACDEKDIISDKSKGLKTFVIAFGKSRFKTFLNILNVFSGTLIVLGVIVGVLPVFSIGILFTILYATYYIHFGSKIINKELFSSVVIDGEFLLWFPFVSIIGMISK